MKAKARNSIRLSTTGAVELLFIQNVVGEIKSVTSSSSSSVTVVARAAAAVVADAVVADVVGAVVVPATSVSSYVI